MVECNACEFNEICEIQDQVKNGYITCKMHTPKTPQEVNWHKRICSMTKEEMMQFLLNFDEEEVMEVYCKKLCNYRQERDGRMVCTYKDEFGCPKKNEDAISAWLGSNEKIEWPAERKFNSW